MKPTKTIRVVANPYAAIDANGVPQGVVGMPFSRGLWVGARLDAEASQKTGKSRFVFTEKPVELPLFADTARAVLEGSLIVADEASAKACGISKFLPVDQALAREAKRATAKFQAERGADARLAEVPTVAKQEAARKAAEAKAQAENSAPTAPDASPALIHLSPTIALDTREEA